MTPRQSVYSNILKCKRCLELNLVVIGYNHCTIYTAILEWDLNVYRAFLSHYKEKGVFAASKSLTDNKRYSISICVVALLLHFIRTLY